MENTSTESQTSDADGKPDPAPDADATANANSTNEKSAQIYENEHYKWCAQTQVWIPKADPTETEHYRWDFEKNEWVLKEEFHQQAQAQTAYDIDENGDRIYKDHDGTVFVWDKGKSAWFPKIDDEFIATYQMNYGFVASEGGSVTPQQQQGNASEEKESEESPPLAEDSAANAKGDMKRKLTQEPPKWFDLDPKHNTKVYVSNLPLDITIDEFAEVMGKCGMIMRDPQTQKHKLKLYSEPDGQLKGDGLCDYIKVESVDLALKILDEYDLRGHKIKVQRAKFEMRGAYNPSLKPKRKKKDKDKLQKMKEKLFDWRPEKMRGERSKSEKVVVIKNLFDPEIFEKEVGLILEYQNDLREECAKCGTVRKVTIFDRHIEGVAQVMMASPEEADVVIQMMHGRYFGKRQLSAEHWDGKTKYKVDESETDTQKRLSKWNSFLETECETKEEPNSQAEAVDAINQLSK